MDMLVMKIMNFAQRLVSADRASLFLVDNKNKGKIEKLECTKSSAFSYANRIIRYNI